MIKPLVELTYEVCEQLLPTAAVGRVAVCTPDGPHIVPVNYSVVEGAVIFRTTPYSVLGAHAWNSQLAFEVDHVVPEDATGWSVVATGRGSLIEDHEELTRVRALWDPKPWAAGQRWLFVALRWDNLTGRRIGPRDVTMAG